MNEYFITNWNFLVKPNDTVYHLGDFAFGNVENIFKRLKGQIHLIIGSHDKNTECCKQLFASYSLLKEIKIDKQYITLCHYSMRTWLKSHYNSWHLFGHSHNNLKSFGKSFDVGIDTYYENIHNKFFLYSFDEVKLIMNELENNFNLIIKKGK